MTLEGAVRVRVDGEAHRLALVDRADVGLADIGVDLHLRQIAGDEEERRRLEARRDGLPDVDAARHDDAVDGRDDARVLEVDARLGERSIVLPYLRLGEREIGARLIEAARGGVDQVLRDDALGAELLVALEVDRLVGNVRPRLRDLGVRIGERRLRLLHPQRERSRIDLRDQLPLRHVRVEIGVDLLNGTRHVRADLHRRDRVDRPCRRYLRDERAARRRLGAIPCVGRLFGEERA